MLFDDARFDEAAALFDHARVVAGGQRDRGREAIALACGAWVKLYECGKPRTRHIITNPIIDAGRRWPECNLPVAMDGHPGRARLSAARSSPVAGTMTGLP
jgi:hypothetical protein